MEKDDINLLPPHAQRSRLWGLIATRVHGLLHVAILGTVLLIITSGFVLMFEIQRQADLETTIRSADLDNDQTSDINQFNELLVEINEVQEAYPPWGPTVAQLIADIPPQIHLTEISLMEDSNKLVITGAGGVRADVIALQDSFLQMSGIATVDSPLQNFATGENQQFTFTIQRELEGDLP